MTRYAIDACDPNGAAEGAHPGDLVLGYCDGICAPAWAGRSVSAWISSTAQCDALVGDCEPGNPGPARWAQTNVKIVYTAEWAPGYTWADVNAAYDAIGKPRPMIWLSGGPWGASGTLPPDPQVVMVQFGYFGTYDLSIAIDYIPGIDAPPPAAHYWGSDQERTMLTIEYGGTMQTFWVDSAGALQHRWVAPGGSPWGGEVVPTAGALVPQTSVGYDVGFNGAFHVFAAGADGAMRHAWFAPGGSWNAERVT